MKHHFLLIFFPLSFESYSQGEGKEKNKGGKTHLTLQEMSLQADLRHLNNMSLHILCVWVWVSKRVLGLPKCTWRLLQEKGCSLMAGSMASSIRLWKGAGEVCRRLAELFPWLWPDLESNLVHRSQSVPWNVLWEVSCFPGDFSRPLKCQHEVWVSKEGKYEFYTPQTYWKVIIFDVECTSRGLSSPLGKADSGSETPG